jgi:hypothetical protein
VRRRGMKTPGSTAIRRPQNAAQPTMCSTGWPPVRRSTIAASSAAVFAADMRTCASSSAWTQPAERSALTMSDRDGIARRSDRNDLDVQVRTGGVVERFDVNASQRPRDDGPPPCCPTPDLSDYSPMGSRRTADQSFGLQQRKHVAVPTFVADERAGVQHQGQAAPFPRRRPRSARPRTTTARARARRVASTMSSSALQYRSLPQMMTTVSFNEADDRTGADGFAIC